MRPRGESFHHLQISPREAFQSARFARQFQAISPLAGRHADSAVAATIVGAVARILAGKNSWRSRILAGKNPAIIV
jgi:hypothetical protein